MTLFEKPVDWEDGRLMSQNNHLIGVWMPVSFIEHGGCWGYSVQFSHSVMSNSLRPHRLQHARLLCPLPTPGAYSNSCPSSQWCHPTISSSVISISSCLQSFPASVYSNESVLQSCLTLCDPMNCSTHEFSVLHNFHKFCSISCPLSHWCHPTISSSVAPFSSYP